jgi:hypothetical protein
MRPASAGHSPIETFAFRVICRWGGVNERRTWNNPTREPWNPIIKACLTGVDQHISLLLQTGDARHAEQAALLRQYVHNLKTWIHETE